MHYLNKLEHYYGGFSRARQCVHFKNSWYVNSTETVKENRKGQGKYGALMVE